MVELIFNYNQVQTLIQANLNDSFNSIIQKYVNKTKLDESFNTVIEKFINKTQLDINNIYFISNGNIISKN